MHQDNHTHPIDADEQLAWQAFAYAAGELPADDSEAFERRLADDLAACEAVAQAVALWQAVAAVGPGGNQSPAVELPLQHTHRGGYWMAGAGAVVAASLLAAVLLPQWGGRAVKAPDVALVVAPPVDTFDHAGIIDAWLETRQQAAVAAPAEVDPLEQWFDAELLNELDETDAWLATLDDDCGAPDWLVSAVATSGAADNLVEPKANPLPGELLP